MKLRLILLNFSKYSCTINSVLNVFNFSRKHSFIEAWSALLLIYILKTSKNKTSFHTSQLTKKAAFFNAASLLIINLKHYFTVIASSTRYTMLLRCAFVSSLVEIAVAILPFIFFKAYLAAALVTSSAGDLSSDSCASCLT